MNIAFFDTHKFEQEAFNAVNTKYKFNIDYLETSLNSRTAELARGSDVVCSFVNDKIDDDCIKALMDMGIRMIALRSAGFNHVDLEAAKRHGMLVTRVPSYSPNSVAEFAVGMLLTLNRKIHKAYIRVKELNFSLDGLVGFDLYKKNVGVIGAGKIGKIFAQIMSSFGCKVLIFDRERDPELEANPLIEYSDLDEICKLADVISLHVPLTPSTYHIINSERMSLMKDGVYIINTGRGALIDSKALIENLKNSKVGGAALDVYEEEENIFFTDLSSKILQDDTLARLLTFPNVLLTSHQAFLTKEALENIAATTMESIDEFKKAGLVPSEKVVNPECCVRKVT